MSAASLCITSGGPLFKCCHSCISCSCLLCCDMPTVANGARSDKWTNIKIMSAYLCVEQMNSNAIKLINQEELFSIPYISREVDYCKIFLYMSKLIFQIILIVICLKMCIDTFLSRGYTLFLPPKITVALLWSEQLTSAGLGESRMLAQCLHAS